MTGSSPQESAFAIFRGTPKRRPDEPVSWETERRLIEVLVAGVRVETVEEATGKRARITVSYCFSQPDHPMPVVLSQEYGQPAG